MKLTDLNLSGACLIDLDCYRDNRGFFIERYNFDKLKALGLDITCAQINHSRSLPGVLRGLHYQSDPLQGKLVGVTRGKIWDVAVDLRCDSPTFGKNIGIELSAQNNRLLWIPPGFGHGFIVLGEEPVDLLYVASGAYNAQTEGGICWDDPELNISWPKVHNLIVSERDRALPRFSEFKKLDLPRTHFRGLIKTPLS